MSFSSDRAVDLVATGEVDLRLVEDVVDQDIARLLGLSWRVSIALRASIPSWVSGVPLVWSVVCRGVVTGDGLLQFLGLVLGDEAVRPSLSVSPAARASLRTVFSSTSQPSRTQTGIVGPAVAGGVLAEVQLELAGFLAGPVEQLRTS